MIVIAANTVIFLHEWLLDPYSKNWFVSLYALTPDHFRAVNLGTSMFLHAGWMHLIGNMWFLWVFGDNIEDILGRARFIFFYVACGVAAGLVHLVFNMDSRIPTVGASGAIAGVMGAYLVKFPHARIKTLVPIFVFFTTFDLPAWWMLVYWFVIQLFSGVGDLARAGIQEGGVAWFAHIGGFLTGMALIRILPTRDRYRYRRDLDW